MGDTPHVRVENAVDNLAVIPYWAGFIPEESLILSVYARPGAASPSHLRRIDIADAAKASQEKQWADFFDIDVAGTAVAFLTALTVEPEIGEATLATAVGFVPEGLRVECVWASGDVYAYFEDGHLGEATSREATDAELTLLAKMAPPEYLSREEFVASFDPSTPIELQRTVFSPDELHAAASRALEFGRNMSEGDAALLALASQLRVLRDLLWAKMTPAEGRTWAAAWKRVAVHAGAESQASAYALAGFAAWLSGDPTGATICIDRVEALDPSYDMIAVVGTMVAKNVPPSTWTEELQQRVAGGPAG